MNANYLKEIKEFLIYFPLLAGAGLSFWVTVIYLLLKK
jgi:hypothetical protein